MRALTCLLLLLPLHAFAQGSGHALRFFGTGSGQQDRVKFRIEAPASVLDIGDDFTIEFWLRAAYADNAGTVSAAAHGDGWIEGNVVVDRDVYGEGDTGDYGIALGRAGPHLRVAFGADAATGRTLVGTNHVGDAAWHHIAVTRVRSSGLMRIYVDGRLDAEGSGPTGDLSYRDGRTTSWPQSDPFLVLAAEKHDAGSAYPSFNGYLDEFRVWTQALTQAQISNVFRTVIATNTAGLIAYYRFEEGSSTNLADHTGRSPTGLLIAGTTGNGQWVAYSSHTNNTAPVSPPGPSVSLQLDSVPAGLWLAVDGVTQATPFTVSLPTGRVVALEAPSPQTSLGTAYVFRCWSDGGTRIHALPLGTNNATRRAGYAAAADTAGDVDGDGIPDDWEAGNDLDCTSGADATSDTDSDQRTAWEEYVAGTSPTNGQNFQRLEIGPDEISNGWKISVATVTGRLYRIEVATNLVPTDWQPLVTNWPGTGSALKLNDTNAAMPRFFRSDIRLSPP